MSHPDRKILWRLLAILLIFAVVVVSFQFTLPVLEGNDEHMQFDYVLWFQRYHTLPDRTAYQTNGVFQESGQPPLTYVLAALTLDLAGIPPTDTTQSKVELSRNRWFAPPDAVLPDDNLNMFIHGASDTGFTDPAVVTANRVARLPSLLYGLLAVLAAFGVSREVFYQPSERRWALLATMIFAFMPPMLYMCAMITNDIMVTLFATTLLWQVLRVLRLGPTLPRAVLIGLLISLCGLSKVNGLLVLPAVGIALLVAFKRHHLPVSVAIKHCALIAVIVLLIFGSWVLWGTLAFNDPLGLHVHDQANAGTSIATLPQLLASLPALIASYVAKYGYSVWAYPVVYPLIGLILLPSLIGYLRHHRQLSTLRRDQLLILVIVLLFSIGGLLYWLRTLFSFSFAITGRLIYFGHIGNTLLLTVGLWLFARADDRRQQAIYYYTVGALTFALITGPLNVGRIFALPHLLAADQLPSNLHGGSVTFDDSIVFLGQHMASTRVVGGQRSQITLCWQVLKRPDRAGAYAVKFFAADGTIIGERTTLHGAGRYATWLWNPGDRFCDTLDVLIRPDLPPAQIFRVGLAMLTPATQAFDWPMTDSNGTPIATAFVGEVASPAGDQSATLTNLASRDIDIPSLATLSGYRLDGTPQPGSTLTLDLLWNVTNNTDLNLVEFVHLIGPENHVLLNASPRHGQYPTWAWSRGERIADSWQFTLPASLPAGRYELTFGFYDPASDQRLAVRQNGQFADDKNATLLEFTVP